MSPVWDGSSVRSGGQRSPLRVIQSHGGGAAGRHLDSWASHGVPGWVRMCEGICSASEPSKSCIIRKRLNPANAPRGSRPNTKETLVFRKMFAAALVAAMLFVTPSAFADGSDGPAGGRVPEQPVTTPISAPSVSPVIGEQVRVMAFILPTRETRVEVRYRDRDGRYQHRARRYNGVLSKKQLDSIKLWACREFVTKGEIKELTVRVDTLVAAVSDLQHHVQYVRGEVDTHKQSIINHEERIVALEQKMRVQTPPGVTLTPPTPTEPIPKTTTAEVPWWPNAVADVIASLIMGAVLIILLWVFPVTRPFIVNLVNRRRGPRP